MLKYKTLLYCKTVSRAAEAPVMRAFLLCWNSVWTLIRDGNDHYHLMNPGRIGSGAKPYMNIAGRTAHSATSKGMCHASTSANGKC